MPRRRSTSSSSDRPKRRKKAEDKKKGDKDDRDRGASSTPPRRNQTDRKKRGRSKSPAAERQRERSESPAPAKRKPLVPAVHLPISEFKEQIIELVLQNSMVVVVGETGSGKTTQIPQYMLDAEKLDECCGKAGKRKIAITQPRRVAAVAMAKRVAQERGERCGDAVGYTIRFENHSNANTRLRYMTDGCLLRECISDPILSEYDVVILDEAHERSLQTDVLFALMKRAVKTREGKLRGVITSATLDVAQFSDYFMKCPVLEVPGRTFKIDMHYHPVTKSQRIDAAVNVALNLHVREGPGHILVFLTGMEECEKAVQKANEKMQALVDSGKEVGDCMIVPLYGMMQSDDQRNVFDEVPEDCRKLIFSTNIAETSLTVVGVGYVIDSGHCKQKYYNPKTGMESLQVTEVSQVQAKQRSGRAGRTQDGKCFRLYSEETFKKSFPKVTVPEILRSNLASVALQMKAMGIDNVVGFDFMEAPDRTRLVKSLRILFLIGAIDADGKLLDSGKSMSQFPLEPQFARVLLAAEELDCLDAVVTLVSMMSSEGVWYRPSRTNADEVRLADAVQSQFVHPCGDHLTLLNVYRDFEENGMSPEWCKKNYIHFRALRQAREIRSQLAEQLQKLGKSIGRRTKRRGPGEEDALVLQAVCAGFFMQTARMCSAGGGWLIVGENILVVPEASSAVSEGAHEWLLYTELVGATIAHVMMRTVSAVQATWLKPLLPMLYEVDLKRLVGEMKPSKKQTTEEQDKAPEVLALEKEEKVSSAKERYLARKAAAGAVAKKK